MIPERLKKELLASREELRNLGVDRLGFFGSVVRGEAAPDSDMDVMVEFVPGQKTFHNFSIVQDILERISGRTVDLLTPEGVSPHIRPYIDREIQYEKL